MNARKNAGFSLTEMLTTVGISGILAATALPSFDGLIADSRLDAASDRLISAVTLARSEAITRNAPVSICKSSGSACTVGGDWGDGWIVFVDLDGNGLRNTATEALVYVEQDQLPDTLSFSEVNYTTAITYRADGSVANTGNIGVCTAEHGGINIAISAVGRAAKNTVAPESC